MLAHAVAQTVYGAARESHNECTRNTLKHSTCSRKWWERFKARSLVRSRLFVPSWSPEMFWWCLLLRKSYFWALRLTARSFVRSSSHLCLVSLSQCAVLWPSRLIESFGCVSAISKDGCGYYRSKIKHNFSWANPSGIVCGVFVGPLCNCHFQACSVS